MQQIMEVKLSDIHPYPKNPRRNDASVDAVANSIKEFGFRSPIIVDGDGEIIAGHTRYKAAKKLKLKTVPVIYADDLTPEQVQALRIADNSAGSKSEWDLDFLSEILGEIGNAYDMADFGLDIGGMAIETDQFPEEVTEDEPPAPPKVATTVRGQIYKLGDHVLLCGDATDPADMDRLIKAIGGGPLIDLVMTDPPYNVAIEGMTKEHLTIENDDMDNAQFEEFLEKAFACMAEHLKEGGSFYIWYATKSNNQFWNACARNGLDIKQNLIWVKQHFVLGRQDYQWRHEPCLYGWKEGAAHYFISDRTLTTVAEKVADLDALGEKELREILRRILAETPTDALHDKKPAASRDHPTMKPVTLLARLIFNSSHKGDTVLDPFGGSGSTMMACEQLGRKCAMMELDPIYCDVIVKRWENLTGRKAETIA